MNIIILAAGRGTRLGKHNNNKPKCLFEINGLSLIERNLIFFKYANLNPILVSGFEKEKLHFLNLPMIYNSEYKETNMLWSLYQASDYMNEDFIVCYSDILINSLLVKKLKSFDKGIGLIIDKDWLKYWQLRFDDPLIDAESLEVSKDGFILDIGKKVNEISKIQGQYIGFFKVSGKDRLLFKDKLIDYCENKKTKHIARKAYLTDFIQYLINNGLKIEEIPINGNWIEIDNHNDVNAAKKSGRLSKIERDVNRIMNKNNL